MKTIFLFLFAFIISFSAHAKIVLKDVRSAVDKKKTRLVFELSGKPHYHTVLLKKPQRLIVDFNNTQLKTNLKKLLKHNSLLKSVHASHHAQHHTRVVLAFRKTVKPKFIVLKPSKRYGYRLLVDAYPSQTKKQLQKHKPVTQAKHRKKGHKTIKVATQKIHAAIKPPYKLRDITVVIDPGHGGKDPGALGFHGTHEKDIVLAIARQLQKLINKEEGMRAVLTRKGDYFISLRGRLRIARRDKADVFMAVHADAFKNRVSHGASVFALSRRGASSEAARWLATKENYSELGGVKLGDKSDLLRSVLIDLSQNVTIGQSLKLGSQELHELHRVASLHKASVEQARFVVLKAPDIPSILVETGFISNREEEKNLRDPKYRLRLATALMKGLRSYFWKNATQGTVIAALRDAKHYKVKSGDTVSKIAKRYHVSVAELSELNHLKNAVIRVGQSLYIPKSRVV